MRLIISKYWHKPEISINLDNEGIELSVSLTDFIRGLVAEIGSPVMILTTSQLEQRALVAMEKTRLKIQEASTQAII